MKRIATLSIGAILFLALAATAPAGAVTLDATAQRPARSGHRHHTRHGHHRHRHQPQVFSFTYTSPPVQSAPVASAPLTPALAFAEDAAGEYWGGQPPCSGPIAISYVPGAQMPAADTGGVDVSPLWAVTTSGTGPGTDTLLACAITFNADVWTPATEQTNFPAFCGLVVHEYGHLFGHPDQASDPPTSITYPIVGPLNEGVPSCVARYGSVS